MQRTTASETKKAGTPPPDAAMLELRELFRDTPDYVKRALEAVAGSIGSTSEGHTESAGRIGSRNGTVSELTAIIPIAKGAAPRLRKLLELAHGNFAAADIVGTLHDMRFVLLDNDTKLLFATTYDGDWDAYIDDFVTKIPNEMDVFFSALEGWPGIHSPDVKDYLVSHQVTADAWYVANPNLSVAQTKRLEKVDKALGEFLDKIT